jgi:hypothetical protein
MSERKGSREGECVISHSLFGEVISAYSRQQAIDDGELVDVSKMAKEAGIRYPTCLTDAVWERYVEVPEGAVGQSCEGRLWDILWMCTYGVVAGHARGRHGSELLFKVRVGDELGRPKPVTLKAVCGPGDQGEPVITIMLPDED